MPCPSCDHTMHSLGRLESLDRIYWCPRCGTIRRLSPPASNNVVSDETPLLVRRAAELAVVIHDRDAYLAVYCKIRGFYESCMTPERRQQNGIR